MPISLTGIRTFFYELAVSHIRQKPLIQLIVDGQRVPFDVHGMRTTFYDLTDPFRIEETKDELADAQEAVEGGGVIIETPISAAVDLKQLRSSGDAMERAVADLAESVADLRAEVRQMGQRAYTTFPVQMPTIYRSGSALSDAGISISSASNYSPGRIHLGGTEYEPLPAYGGTMRVEPVYPPPRTEPPSEPPRLAG